mgnify:CR=1 FL=1
MIYLFLGEDGQTKENTIADLKAKCLGSADAVPIDSDSLDATKLDPAAFKKALITLPVLSSKRFILIRSCEKLKTHNKKIILEFLESDPQHVVLVLDSKDSSAKNAFFKKIMNVAQVTRFGSGEQKENVFAVTRALESRNISQALKILGRLLENGDHPLQILGGLVWFWGKTKPRLSADGFKKGLLVLQEADLDIKRSRLKPQYAVEIAVTKLGSIIAC